MRACASAQRDHFRHQQLSATSEIRKDEFSSTQGRKKKKLLPPAENMRRVNGGSPDALLASLVLALALMQGPVWCWLFFHSSPDAAPFASPALCSSLSLLLDAPCPSRTCQISFAGKGMMLFSSAPAQC